MRSQLPEINDIYDIEGELKTPFYKHEFCSVCGLRAEKQCGNCHRIKYCSKEHQTLDWSNGHKKTCKTVKNETDNSLQLQFNEQSDFIKSWTSTLHFPELELDSEPEPSKSAIVDPLSYLENITLYDPIMDPSPEDDEDDTEVEVDSPFLKFEKRVARAPDQVMRYDRHSEPLLVSASLPPFIPPCPHCLASRSFEFQVCIFLNLDNAAAFELLKTGS